MFDRITDSIFAHTEGKTIGNVGVIASEIGNFVIDTSMFPKVAYEIRKELETIKTGKLLGGFYTHYHFDHTGGAQHFHDVPMYAHELVKQNFMESYKLEMKDQFLSGDNKDLFEGLEITPPSHIFTESTLTSELSPDIDLYVVGGHTSGSTLIHYKPEDVVFAGDNIFSGRFPWGGDQSASPYDWMRAINKILELNPSIVVPGHGPVLHNLQEVNRYGQYLVKIVNTVKMMLNESEEKILEDISEISFNEETRPGLKETTLKHWINVIKTKENSH